MRCKVCGRDFPSLYHFKTADVCLGCYEGMTDDDCGYVAATIESWLEREI